MAKAVKFSSTTSGSYDDQHVKINDNDMSSDNGSVSFSANVSDANLVVTYSFFGDNGDNYTIKYKCTSGGTAVSDPDNPTDVKGNITDNGVANVTLTIPL